MSGEYLTFSKSGQWELHKATNDKTGDEVVPKSDYKPGSKEYKVYRGAALTGDLHADHGTKGSLRDHGGGTRPKNGSNFQNAGKPYKENASVFTERNPGVGD